MDEEVQEFGRYKINIKAGIPNLKPYLGKPRVGKRSARNQASR